MVEELRPFDSLNQRAEALYVITDAVTDANLISTLDTFVHL
jgi:hypothetical protein